MIPTDVAKRALELIGRSADHERFYRRIHYMPLQFDIEDGRLYVTWEKRVSTKINTHVTVEVFFRDNQAEVAVFNEIVDVVTEGGVTCWKP
jgi:hypothetical protein